jgi:molecular chaperone GrpE
MFRPPNHGAKPRRAAAALVPSHPTHPHMSQDQPDQPLPQEQSQNPDPQDIQDAHASPDAGAPQDPPPPPSPEEEIARWKDLALRSAAELDNYRKRVARELSDARLYANQSLLEDLLPILDNFEMGLEAARQESASSMIFQGMSMVHKQIASFLSDQGVEPVEPASGAEFDPASHEAIAQEQDQQVNEGLVLRCTRRGYRLASRLLRPANVVVSAGTPS